MFGGGGSCKRGGGGGRFRGGGGGQGRCKQRSEVFIFVKIQKNIFFTGGGSDWGVGLGGGVRMDVNEKLKILFCFFGGGVGSGGSG